MHEAEHELSDSTVPTTVVHQQIPVSVSMVRYVNNLVRYNIRYIFRS